MLGDIKDNNKLFKCQREQKSKEFYYYFLPGGLWHAIIYEYGGGLGLGLI